VQPEVKHKVDAKGFATTVKLNATPYNSEYVSISYFNLKGETVRIVLVKKGKVQNNNAVDYDATTNTFSIDVAAEVNLGSNDLYEIYPKGLESLIPPVLASTIRYEPNATGKVAYTKNRKAIPAESTTLGTVSESMMLQDPGVSGAVLFTHSQDGANQLYTMEEFNGDALNVHDAYYYALGQAEEGARTTNKGMRTIHREGSGVITNASKYLQEMFNYALKEGVANETDGFFDRDTGKYIESESERITRTVKQLGTRGKIIDEL
jgi:hypothetical protein